MFRAILSRKVSRVLFAGLGLGLTAACLPAAQGADSHTTVPPVANRPVVSVATPRPTPQIPPVKPTLLIYGDSLTVLSEGAVNVLYGAQSHVVFRAFGGTSLCDWTAHAAQDRAEVHPTRVVIAFTGNAASCSRDDLARGGVKAWLANYQRSLLSMRRTFSGLPISVVGSPAVRPQSAGTWYPENGNPLLNQMYRQMCAQYGMHYNASADETLTPGHVFQWQRPAFPGNGPLTTVRAPDGVHVLPAGALYYAAALGGE
jgi:hypothetical protein